MNHNPNSNEDTSFSSSSQDPKRQDQFYILSAEEARQERLKLPFWSRIDDQKYWLHALLFLLTILTTAISGAMWVGKEVSLDSGSWGNFVYGMPYSICLLLILTCHEFGHFFATLYHAVRASLPFFIPMPPIPILLHIGTFGAMIRTRERIPDSVSLFDIGVYGPIAGFVVAFIILVIGFITVPPIDYLYQIHPEYQVLGAVPELSGSLFTGKNLLYWGLEQLFYSPDLPPMTEMYHYPLLFTGWLGCFVTALNLLPVGQLDGGHIIYAMFGEKLQERIGKVFLGFIILLGLPSFIEWMTFLMAMVAGLPFDGFNYPSWVSEVSWPSWIIWALILFRFIGIKHPPVAVEVPLDSTRMKIGWVSIIIFVLCFTPVPFGQLP